MATPLSNDKLLAALKAEGCKVVEIGNWRTHNRNHKGSWGPINGVMIHHTGSDVQGTNYVRNILSSGYAGLPGPLCHVGIAMDGTVYLVSNGRANHAGGGDPAVFEAVKAEAAWLMQREAKPTKGNSNGYVGNANFYGAEVMYDGGQPMTAAQEDASVRFAAAICRAYGWSARSVIGHREWSRDKIDPGNEPMVTFRRKVQARLDGKPVAATVAPKAAAPAKPAAPVDAVSLKAILDSIKSGQPSTDVREVQDTLNRTGRTAAAGYPPIPLDGRWTPRTRYAYRKHQEIEGYSGGDADGYPGPESLPKLGDWIPSFKAVE